jgi:hypothetical protein
MRDVSDKVVEELKNTHFMFNNIFSSDRTVYDSVSQPPSLGPLPGPGIKYTGQREVLLEFVILIF